MSEKLLKKNHKKEKKSSSIWLAHVETHLKSQTQIQKNWQRTGVLDR